MDEEGARHGSRPKLGLPVSDVPYEGDDLISALPDDLLLQVLGLLDSVRAARLVSRRWHGVLTRLPKVTVTLHDIPFGSLKGALRRAPRPRWCHYLLDIRVPGQDDMVSPCRVSSLLHAAAGLSPAELRFTLPRNLKVSSYLDVDLPLFRGTTSIELCARDLRLVPINLSLFHSLERFSLSGCHIDLVTFIPRCPRLRVLRLNTIDFVGMDNITIHSASLEELAVEHKNRWTDLSRISIEAPVLKQLAMSFHVCRNLGVSILAPMMKKVSWRCLYTRFISGLGLWGLSEVCLKTVEIPGRPDSVEDACLQLPSVHALSLHMCAQDSISFPNAELSFVAEIDKHMVTNFSSLDLHFTTKGHVFGAIMLHLLGLHRIRTAIHNLRIALLASEVKDACPVNCLCDDPKDWKAKSIYLASLEKVEIEGVQGEDHEIDFVTLIFRCAPLLKRVTVKLSEGVTPNPDWRPKINHIVKAYPVVECNIDLGPGSANNS